MLRRIQLLLYNFFKLFENGWILASAATLHIGRAI